MNVRSEERAHELGGEARPDHLGAEAEHVHVVVLDALVRGVDVVADRRADPDELARRHGRADAGAADEHAALGTAVENRVAQLLRLVRIVDAHRVGVRSQVDDRVAVGADRLEQRIAKMDAAVIERDGDVHQVTRSRRASTRATTLSTL